jgi:hypothetical protein
MSKFEQLLINGLKYQCWHEVGHATACLHFGGDVAYIELIDDERIDGLARAGCSTTPDIRPMVACGGFAAEYFLFYNKLLTTIEPKAFTQLIFINATKDREMFCGRTLLDQEQFTKAEDEAFMHFAINKVAPIFSQYFTQMEQLVDELITKRKVYGARVREILKISSV